MPIDPTNNEPYDAGWLEAHHLLRTAAEYASERAGKDEEQDESQGVDLAVDAVNWAIARRINEKAEG